MLKDENLPKKDTVKLNGHDYWSEYEQDATMKFLWTDSTAVNALWPNCTTEHVLMTRNTIKTSYEQNVQRPILCAKNVHTESFVNMTEPYTMTQKYNVPFNGWIVFTLILL